MSVVEVKRTFGSAAAMFGNGPNRTLQIFVGTWGNIDAAGEIPAKAGT
jgi:hypothetical protein